HRRGLSFGQIALKLGRGLTRNAIGGKLDRLKLLKSRPRDNRDYGAPRTQKRRKAPSKPVAPSSASSAPPTPELHVNFFDLKRHHCRYPLSDGTFCGRKVQRVRTAFCPHHELVCYRAE